MSFHAASVHREPTEVQVTPEYLEPMSSDTTVLPVIVIGAGAAGLMAALACARGGSPVILLESTTDGGRNRTR